LLQLDVADLRSNPSNFITRIVLKLELPEFLSGNDRLIKPSELVEETIRFISSLDRALFQGKRSESIAAAALYVTACRIGWNILQRNIAHAADVTEVTIRNTIDEIEGGMLAHQKTTRTEPKEMSESHHRAESGESKTLLQYVDHSGNVRTGNREQIQELRIEDHKWYWSRQKTSGQRREPNVS